MDDNVPDDHDIDGVDPEARAAKDVEPDAKFQPEGNEVGHRRKEVANKGLASIVNLW